MWATRTADDDDASSDQQAERTAAWSRRTGPPDNEVPSAVAVGAVITRDDDVAVVLTAVRVFSTGVLLDVGVRRRLDPASDEHETFGATERALLLGVELADGRTATTLPGALAWDAPVDVPALVHHGAGGGGRVYDLTCWLSPGPPPGDVLVVAAAPVWGLPEGSVTLAAAALADARSRVRVLWPREPDRPWSPQDVPAPHVPPGGWFARVLDAR